MQDVKKIEIIIDIDHLQDTLKILDYVEVSGYTVINDISGKGERGLSCSDLNCDLQTSYLMTVCTNEKQLNSLMEKMQPLLIKFGGVCIVNNAQWVIH